jgi:hypothetical protein
VAAPTCVITTVKSFTYRGVPGEEWSNTYMLSGATPADSPAWRSLYDALTLEEKKLYTPSSRATRAYGYDKVPVKGDHAIWSVDLRPSSTTVPGTLSSGVGSQMSGDQAVWVRWSLDRFNSYGKRVYLRKYFHGGMLDTGGLDNLLPAYITALNAFGTFMSGGTLLGSRKICDHLGNLPIASAASTFVTTRTLKRRSKRKDPS